MKKISAIIITLVSITALIAVGIIVASWQNVPERELGPREAAKQAVIAPQEVTTDTTSQGVTLRWHGMYSGSFLWGYRVYSNTKASHDNDDHWNIVDHVPVQGSNDGEYIFVVPIEKATISKEYGVTAINIYGDEGEIRASTGRTINPPSAQE